MMVVNEYLFSFSLLHLSLILIICGLISILQKYFLKFWSLRKFRGPYALPVVGNCYNPNAFSLLRYLTELKKKYGKTFVLCLFQKTYLVTMEPAVLRKFFTDTKAFVKCDNYRQLSSLVLGDSLATSTHEYHRHIFSQYFSLSNISSSLPLFQQITRDTTLELIDPHLGQNISIDIQLFFSRLALRMFLQYSMGYAYQQKEVREIEVPNIILIFYLLFFLLIGLSCHF